jgi:hypothetical protein
MGMACSIRALTEGQIEVLFDHPDRVWDIAYNDLEIEDEDEDEDEKIESLATLLGEPLLEDLWLEKSWAILRFLLRKAAGRQPSDIHDLADLSSELLWGERVGDEPADYVGPFLRSVEETQEFAAFLQPLTLDQLLSHLDCEEMRKAGVYGISDEDGTEEGLRRLCEYVGHHFQALREYVRKAADSRCGLLLWVN